MSIFSRASVNEALSARGMLTIEQQADPQPMDKFWSHNAVRSLESLEQWCRMERETYLYLKAAHDVGVVVMTEQRYDEILMVLVQLHSFHANVRQVLHAQVIAGNMIPSNQDEEEGHY